MGDLITIPRDWRRRLVFFLLFSCLMIILAEIGFAMSLLNLGFSTLWPPCGLFLSALTFSGNMRRDWRDIFVAAAFAHVVSDFFIHGATLGMTLCFIASNSVSASLAALAARRLLGQTNNLQRLIDILIFLGCGLLILAPLAATSGLWLQSVFFNQQFTPLRWATWWSANALGVSCFGILSLATLRALSVLFRLSTRADKQTLPSWLSFEGRSSELILMWMIFSIVLIIVQYNIAPPFGLVLNNFLLLFCAYRFGIVHSSLALAFSSILRLSHAWSSFLYMTPFANDLILKQSISAADAQLGVVVSVQLFLIERGVLVSLAAALFSDLRRKQNALQEAAESRERLMARMSHEIRTPLGGMLGLVEAWAMKEKNQQRTQDLRMILNSAEQLKRVIDDVLDFSKLSAGKMKTEAIRCNLRELFHELVSLHSADAERKGLTLELQVQDHLVDEVVIDSLRLRQIVNNLIANAIKFTHQGWVRMSVGTFQKEGIERSILKIVVEDSGIGISKAAINNLFQPFEQLGRETTRTHGGTGLGLAICRELCELLGGRIFVESTRGKGSRFVVELPFSSVESDEEYSVDKQRPVLMSEAFVAVRKQHSVLVVEDDPVNQIVATRFLEAEGCDVLTVDSGPKALALLEEQPTRFSLVLMDYFMPVMDGCEVTRKYRTAESAAGLGEHLPIIGLTASILASNHQRCRMAGMDDVLLKPIERRSLKELLKKYLAA